LYAAYPGASDPTSDVTRRLASSARLPGVAKAASYRVVAFSFVTPTAGEDRLGVSGVIGTDGLFTTIDRAKVLAGRRPASDRAGEAAVTPAASRILHIGVGSILRLRAWPAGQVDRLVDGFQEPIPGPGTLPVPAPASGPIITLRVVGVETAPGDREFYLGGAGTLHLSPAFLTAWPGLVTRPALAIRTLPGSQPKVMAALQRELVSVGVPPPVIDRQNGNASVIRSTRLLAWELEVFAMLLVLLAIIAIGQTVIRQAQYETVDHRILRRLGMTRRQLRAAVVVQATVAATCGAVVAMVVAAGTSLFTPIGLARQIEPSPGLALNVAWLAAGFGVIVAGSAIVAAGAAWLPQGVGRASGPGLVRRSIERSGPQPGRVLSPAAVPASAVIGLRVFNGRRGSMGTAIVVSVVAVGAIAAVLTFNASLGQLLHTPRLYGWAWDAYVGNPYRGLSAEQTKEVTRLLDRDPAVRSYSIGTFANVRFDGHSMAIPLEALSASDGSPAPPIVAGSPPRGDDDVVLGATDLRALHLAVGDSVDLWLAGGPLVKTDVVGNLRPQPGTKVKLFNIVGRAVFAHMVGNQTSGPLGHGAWVTLAAFRSWASGPATQPAALNEFLVRFAPGTDASQELDRLRGEFEVSPYFLDVRGPIPPTDIQNVGTVNRVPTVLGALLVVAAAAMFAQALVATIWRGRRDIAILRTLGFVRRQVFLAVIGHATTVVLVGVALGLPLGVIAGHAAWLLFASGIGIVATRTIAARELLFAIPWMLVLASLVAVIPAHRALRIDSALALRTE
jgi:hypothetical protein